MKKDKQTTNNKTGQEPVKAENNKLIPDMKEFNRYLNDKDIENWVNMLSK